MKIANLVLLLALLSGLACAKRATNHETEAGARIGEDSEFVVDAEENTPTISQSGPTVDDQFVAVSDVDVAPTDQLASTENTQEMRLGESEVGTEREVKLLANIADYDVEEGDTLMWVAFKIYGDYGKWKSIKGLNPGLAGKRLVKGMRLKYYVPEEKFVWNPKGSPYLIKIGDTLGTIAKDKYGTERRWKDLYENNRPMIKKPNLIFAGFTLYYIPERDVASGI